MNRKTFLIALADNTRDLASGSALFGVEPEQRTFADQKFPDKPVLEWLQEGEWIAVLGVKNIGEDRIIDQSEDKTRPQISGIIPNDKSVLLNIHQLAKHDGMAQFRISDGSSLRYMFEGVVMAGKIGKDDQRIIDVRIGIDSQIKKAGLIAN